MNNHKAYTELLMRHSKTLWRMCWRRAHGDDDKCRDLLQEVSIALWENRHKLRPDSTPRQESAWVQWQARSVFFQLERRQKATTVPLDETLIHKVSDEETMHRKELFDHLLAALSPEEQHMVQLYLDGYRSDEIAQQMGISRDNYYQRMHRAVRKLRRFVLTIIILLLTTTVAIAVVPEWRHRIFGSGVRRTTLSDTLPHEPQTNHPSTSIQQEEPVFQPVAETDTSPTLEPMEHIEAPRIVDLLDIPLLPPEQQLPDNVTIAIDGTRLTITGAAGELVRVYDQQGNLVASQRASHICIIDLYPNSDSFLAAGRYTYRLVIGNRQALQVVL